MTRDPRLARLLPVTGLAWEVARRRLAVAARGERAAEAAIARLDARRKEILARETTVPGELVATARWLRWAETERARMNGTLARARAATEEERAQAARAFGRDQALQAVLARQPRRRDGGP